MNLDDPRLTAYALDELDEQERAEFEAQLDDAARREIETIRRAAGKLSEELEAEPCPRLTPEQRLAILPAEERRWPVFWWILTGSAAALVIVALLLPALSTARPKKAQQLALHGRVETDSLEGHAPSWPTAENGRAEARASAPTPSVDAIAPALRLDPSGEIAGTPSDETRYSLKKLDAPAEGAGRSVHQFNALGVASETTTAATPQRSAPLVVHGGSTSGGGGVAFRSWRDAGVEWGDAYTDSRRYDVPGNESYAPVRESDFVSAARQPLSTFGLDVDTASYANVRRFLMQGQWPPRDAVRIEEMLNYFSYDYPRPRGNEPFALYVETAECPWNPAHRLALIGLRAKDVPTRALQPMNLVFLIDVSGSMQPANKLPLIKDALRLLVRQLTARDRVAIIVYASNARVLLPSTRGDRHETILEAIDSLEASGSTNGGEGIQWAYREATRNFIEAGVNRVILCTDGDFNVGITDQRDLVRLIQQQARTGVFLSVFGFGMGNLKDSTMQKLANAGNGQYAYIDDLEEARKLLVDQVRSTLVTVAKDAKLQVEFNPALVDSYRLIGYEKRALRPRDFADDRKDAGDIGAGHTVTALYEIIPVEGRAPSWPHRTGDLMTVKLRYKEPDAGKSQLLTANVKDTQTSWRRTSDDFRFAAAVACFGMTLRDSEYRASATFDLALELAGSARGRDEKGYRSEFIQLIRRAREITGREPVEDRAE